MFPLWNGRELGVCLKCLRAGTGTVGLAGGDSNRLLLEEDGRHRQVLQNKMPLHVGNLQNHE